MNCHEQEHQELAATTSNNGLDWLEDSISFLTADVDIGSSYEWWSTPAAEQQDDIGSVVAQTLSPPAPLATTSSPLTHASPIIASPAVSLPSEPSSKKRKSPAHKASGQSSGNQRRRAEQDRQGCGSGGGKKGGAKGGGAGSDRDTRWAEQLLNPCAAAVEAGNLSRVQHMFYVLGELASFSGDANHRLAAHGLRALARRLPAAVGLETAAAVRVPPCECPTPAFAGAEPQLFRASLIKFHEVSPWFALPNVLANAAITQASACCAEPRLLHVVDLGVSHGVQWPTLLESLTRLPGGRAPPSVRLTVAGPAATPPAPFCASPQGYDFSPHLLRYAKSINLQLAIARAASLESVHGFATPGEALVVCIQFRLGHVTADERTDILKKVRRLNPELVVLSELDAGGDGTAAGDFLARLELLWRFLESTSAAFKGREGEERRLLEAEAGTSVPAEAAGEGKEVWRERMAAAGFEEVAFGDEAVESAKSLLRKYDGGWEMSVPAASGGACAVALRWKGQPVSFCSLWRAA
ncbi:protein NODULATION SIGNALING PATHWAY 1-like [Phragmites australis]|uniref:protein NODULATION SIGNALING PATHWAY 1-like n=1 Tax=Phragmites australis TaxID=29695 RepID=UPI002D77A41A|nr:protein NODULATION SIGNALING PATHWAY 1-like [Phragmites australis]